MKKIPEIRFPEFSGEWVEKRLGEVCQFYKGKGISKNDIVNNKKFYKCIRYGELYTTYAEIIKEVLNYTNYENPILSKVNDVLIPSSGETAEDISTASCILEDNVAIGGDVNILRCKVYGQFLSYYLKNKKKKDIAKLAQGVSIVHLYANNLKSLKIHIPPTLDEQKKIANFLSSVDEKIEIVSKKIEELKKYKKGMLQKLLNVKCNNGKCEPELRFKGFSGDWIEKRLGELIEERNEKTTINNQYPILTSSKEGIFLQEKYFSKQTASENNIGYKIIYFGDFTYRSMSDTGHFTFNIQNIIEKGIVSPAYPVFKVVKNKTNSLFIYYSLNYSTHIKKQILILRQGGTRLALNLNKLKSLKLHLPPTLAEQEKIASFLSSIDEKIELNEKKLEKLKAYKKGLLQKIFV